MSLQRRTVMTLKMATTMKMAKNQASVAMQAPGEKLNWYCGMATPKSAAVANESSYEMRMPRPRPRTSDPKPMKTVSYSRMRDTCPGLMPSTR